MDHFFIGNMRLTSLQEEVLIELNKTINKDFICKKLSIKPISLSKAISTLITKELFLVDKITEKGKKMVHYLEFKNETISLFLKKHSLDNIIYKKQLAQLDYNLIILLRNLI